MSGLERGKFSDLQSGSLQCSKVTSDVLWLAVSHPAVILIEELNAAIKWVDCVV
jgi:hypothetical protein